MIREMFASDEQIAGITQDVWSSFVGTVIGSADEKVALDAVDVTVGCVAVTGDWKGCVLLACPKQLARTAASAMFDLPAEQLTGDEIADALGELTNMVAGISRVCFPDRLACRYRWSWSARRPPFGCPAPCLSTRSRSHARASR
jgi:hypothetical protein